MLIINFNAKSNIQKLTRKKTTKNRLRKYLLNLK